MSSSNVSESQLLDALRKVPSDRWDDVLQYLNALQSAEPQSPPQQCAIRTAAELAQSDLVGIWADRTEITEGREFASKLREQAERRRR